MGINVTQEHDKKYKPLLSRIKDKVLNMSRIGEKGIVNKAAKSSFSMRDNGDINTVSSKYAQHKLSAGGKSTDIANESVTITNTKKLTFDELVVNGHKFNNQLYEYADLKMVNGNEHKLVTGLALEATVLTKSWEPSLERYVLIRRPARFAMFSQILNTADTPDNLSIDTSLLSEFKDMIDIQKAADIFSDFSDTKKGAEQ